ncbi:MAG: RNA methyltransferase [Pseudomonadota bacterium]
MSGGSQKLRWVIGQHSCMEAVKANSQWVKDIHVQEDRQRENAAFIALCEKEKLKVRPKGRKFFVNLGEGHQGVAVSLTGRPTWGDEKAEKDTSLVVFLDGITDPHNLGAILRTAWLLEADGIFIPKDRRVDLTPVVCKVASGGAEHVSVESCHFQTQLQWFKDQGYWVYGLGEKGAIPLPKQDLSGKVALVVGAEGKGLRSSTEKFCDQLLSIPQVAGGSSYNASVAFSISAYEWARKRFL